MAVLKFLSSLDACMIPDILSLRSLPTFMVWKECSISVLEMGDGREERHCVSPATIIVRKLNDHQKDNDIENPMLSFSFPQIVV